MSKQKASAKRPHGTGSVRPGKGRKWEGRFEFEGKPRSVSLGVRKDIDPINGITETEAQKKLQKIIASYAPPKQGDKIKFGVLCDKFIVHKESLNLSPNSMEGIRSAIRVHLRPEFEKRDADAISADDLQRLQGKMMRDRAPKTVKNIMSVAYSIFEYGVVNAKVLESNPMREVEKIKALSSKLEMIVLSTDELDEIRAAFPDTPLGRQDSVMVLLAARSGLRQGEAISLRWKNIDWTKAGGTGGKIRVATSYERVSKSHKRPKSYKTRALPLADEVAEVLEEHFKRSRFNKDSDLIFPHPETGHELDGAALNDRFKAAMVAANIRPESWEIRKRKTSAGNYKDWTHVPISWHDLRHSWGTFLAAAGFGEAAIAAWCGWADRETMERYLHFSPGDVERDQLNAAIKLDRERRLGETTPDLPQKVQITSDNLG